MCTYISCQTKDLDNIYHEKPAHSYGCQHIVTTRWGWIILTSTHILGPCTVSGKMLICLRQGSLSTLVSRHEWGEWPDTQSAQLCPCRVMKVCMARNAPNVGEIRCDTLVLHSHRAWLFPLCVGKQAYYAPLGVSGFREEFNLY